ncbi:MAG: exodeoxyribonuclease small subunit [Methanolobus sp.]|jgi:exodeoxyribonuclease VII small subunit|uniref:exodeoxyribonuclease VII small subunit n=1 Tax=Methanolobus sp. TaxID=1874737 RepID=UPI00258A5F6B|nr:exodeoxyribonuclease VII small subunit [Methanolobus sp.]MDK2831675.1 exodeoxyribonuclease small subunit [Methanolobus sp.]MDK2939582.1 exodeoxyribonuclease small subunit [Methanolobus sp.]
MARTRKSSEENTDVGKRQMSDLMSNSADSENLGFEESLEELESLVENLERGQMTLDESLGLFERGMKLARICNQKLSKAERKIEILIEENGNLKTETFIEE